MVRVTYACRDGSPFPVDFATADDVRSTWHLDREHAPEARTPLADSISASGQRGEARAYEESGVTLLPTLERARPVANGYAYALEPDLTADGWARLGSELVDLVRRHGGNAAVWSERCLPQVQADCDWLRDAPAATSFGDLAERRDHAWGLTSVAGLVARIDERAIAASCEPVVGDRATAIAYQLAQGSDNETIAADDALAQLAALEPGSAEADAARRELLAGDGTRSTSWSIDHPTFAERPDLLDAQLRLVRRAGARNADRAAGAADRRARFVAEIEAALDEPERARFHRRLERLEAFVPVREARARWQLVASGAMRAAVQRRGRDLVDRGILDAPDDVFFLVPAEYDEPSGDLRPAIATRRAEHAHWCSIVPPPTIGGDGRTATATATDTATGTGTGTGTETVATAGSSTVRGIPGAPGTATGLARVILDLDDVERLEPGDVLVATMTSPVWTPLFAIAAAVVTDAGDALSHVAIAAREYGIACVAGTHDATVRIADGRVVTVDGDAGIVHLA